MRDLLYTTCSLLLSVIHIDYSSGDRSHVLFKNPKRVHKQNNRISKELFLNTWAVVVHGGEETANKVAAENGFINKGKVLGSIYEFEHKGIPRRKKRASFIKTMYLEMDTRVAWAQQQVSKIRKARSIHFNDDRWQDQWYLYQRDPELKGHDMNVMPVWERGITGKGIVISVLDDGIEYTHPELKHNYDPKASYDYNDNDPDPMPRYSWREDNKHGTRCAGEIAAAANNSNCIVGVAFGARIGGIRMLDGEITDLIEAQSLLHARDHIDIYSVSWGPEDDGMTVDGPGVITTKALEGAIHGRQGKGSIIVWASGNGGDSNDNCNCDGYTNSIYTISVSAASSVGYRPWFLESCASTLVAAYSSGSSKTDRHIITSDMSSGCTDRHTGTSVSPPLISGFIALALEVNPNLSWRDVQHLLVETSSLTNLVGDDFRANGVGKRFSHHFGFGVIDAAKLVSFAERWVTVEEQKVCHHRKEVKSFPFNRFNKSAPLQIEIDVSKCNGDLKNIMYLEHVQIRTTFYHHRRGAAEILIESPMKTQSWVLRERGKDVREGEFTNWTFLSNHFWGENPVGIWKVTFFSTDKDEYGQGFLQDITLITFGSVSKPAIFTSDKDTITKPYKCHSECKMGCTGTSDSDCKKCQRYRFIGDDTKTNCVASCPSNMFTVEEKMLCLPCHPSCLTCRNSDRTHCITCPKHLTRYRGTCLEDCPSGMYSEEDIELRNSFVCKECSESCITCEFQRGQCTSCAPDSILQQDTCVPKCSSLQWFDGRNCQLCDATCKTCNGATELNCTSCQRKALNDAEDRYFYKSSQCLLSCPLGTFKDDTLMENCLDCPNNCLICSNGGRTCDICRVSHYRVNSADGRCVEMCPAGYYTDVLRRVCEPCNALCNSCVPGQPSACTSCAAGYYLKDHDCVSSNECNARYFVNTTSGKCSFCPEACDSCDSANRCYSCFFNYFLTPNGKCEEKCPDGSYALERATICEKCDETCSKCDGPSPQDCLACPIGKTLQNGRCRDEILGMFYLQKINFTSEAKRCHHTCQTCDGPEPMNCIQCIHSSLDKRSAGCMNPCVNQYLSENSCKSCHPSCRSCFGPQANQCLDCYENFTLNIDTYTCNKACHRRFYEDVANGVCKPCHRSCSSCFGPGPDQCITCPDKLHFFKNTCLLQCPAGLYKSYGQKCAPCSKSCGKCVYKYDFCSHCPPDHVWDNYKCFKSCGVRKFHNESSSRRRCFECDESCLHCDGTAPNECTACDPGFTLVDGMCIQGCLHGFYNSSLTGQCTPCADGCLKCKEINNGKTQCTACSNRMFLLPGDGTCLKNCPPGTYNHPTDNICKSCPGKGCQNCDQDYGKSCQVCKPMYDLSHGLCKTTCAVGRYPDEKLEKCMPCHNLCYSCNGPTVEDCTRCSATALMLVSSDKEITCREFCPEGFYSSVTACLPCNASCSTCINEHKCSSCHWPLALHKYKCVPSCPTGFFLNEEDNTCISCRFKYGSCSLCDSSRCNVCKPGSEINGKVCSFNCGESFVKVDKKCVSCPTLYKNCRKCNLLACTECDFGYELSNNVCVEKCEPGLILTNGKCIDENLRVSTHSTLKTNENFTLSATEFQPSSELRPTSTEPRINLKQNENVTLPEIPVESKANISLFPTNSTKAESTDKKEENSSGTEEIAAFPISKLNGSHLFNVSTNSSLDHLNTTRGNHTNPTPSTFASDEIGSGAKSDIRDDTEYDEIEELTTPRNASTSSAIRTDKSNFEAAQREILNKVNNTTDIFIVSSPDKKPGRSRRDAYDKVSFKADKNEFTGKEDSATLLLVAISSFIIGVVVLLSLVWTYGQSAAQYKII